MAEQKIAGKGLSTLPGGFEVGKNDFFNENFQFSPQRIIRFSKMAKQKKPRKELSSWPEGFQGWKKRFF